MPKRVVVVGGSAAGLLTAANTKIASLEAEIVTLKAASGDFTAQINTLTEGAATAKAALATKDTELKNVQAELATAQGKANAVIASQGLAPEKLPPLEPKASEAKGEGDLTEQCLRAKAKEAARN